MTRLITLVMSASILAFFACIVPSAAYSGAATTPTDFSSAPAKTDVFSANRAKAVPLPADPTGLALSTFNTDALMDVSFTVESVTADPGDQTCLDVSVDNFTDIVSFQFSFNWNETLIAYDTTQNFNLTDLNISAVGTANVASGDLSVSWFHNATTGVTVPDGTVIFQVCYDVEAAAEGQTVPIALSGNPTSVEVTDNTGAVLPVDLIGAQITVSGTPPPPPPAGDVSFTVSSATADAGNQVCLDVSVENFTDIVSFQYSMNWDENLLTYAATQNYNLTDLVAASFGTNGTANGDLTLSWLHNATTGVTVPDGTVIYQVCFDVENAAAGQTASVSLSGSPTAVEVTNNNSDVVDAVIVSGQITVNGGGGGGGTNTDQLTFIAESVTADDGTQECIDVSVEGFTDIVSAQYTMNFDASILTYASVQNFNLTDLNAASFGTNGTANGNLTLSWLHNATTGVTVPDGTVIYQVCFDVAGADGATANISFSGNPTAIEVTDNNADQVTPDFTAGVVTVNNAGGGNGGGGGGMNSDQLAFIFESVTAENDSQECFDVSVEGFNDIVSAQYTMNFDASVLTFASVQNFNLTDLNASAFGTNGTANGNLTMSWLHNATTGVTVPDGTVIYQVCFDVNGTDGQNTTLSFSGNPTAIEVTNNNSDQVTPDFTSGQITISGDNGGGTGNTNLTFTIEDQDAQTGDMICLDVSVENFTDIVSAQYTMIWDETELQFDNVQNFNLTDLNASAFGTSGTANGELTMSWLHQATTGVTLPNNTVIYQVCYTVLSGVNTTPLVSFTGNPTAIEVTDNSGTEIDFFSNPGQVTVTDGGGTNPPDDVTFTFGNQVADVNESFCVPVTVETFDEIVSFQYTMNWNAANLTYTGVQNFNLAGLNESGFGTNGVANGVLTVSWFDNTTQGITLPDNAVLYEVCFDAGNTAGTTSLSFSGAPTAIEVTTTNNQVLPADFVNGAVLIEDNNGGGGNGDPTNNDNLTFTMESITAAPGSNQCLDVTVNDFFDIASFQYSINWDVNELTYTGIQNFASLGQFSAASFGTNNVANGVLTLSWDDPTASGEELPNGTVLFQICYDVEGDAGSASTVAFSGTPTASEVTASNGSVLDPTFNNGIVSVEGDIVTDDIVFRFECENAQPGEQICLPVTVENYENIFSFQYSMHWNANVLQFDNVQAFGFPEMTDNSFSNPNNNTLAVVHESGSPATLPDGATAFEVCFTVTGNVGQNSLMTFNGNPVSVEVLDGNFNTINVVFGTCAVNVADNCTAVLIAQNSITNVACNGGNTGAIDVDVTGGDNNYTYSWVNDANGSIIASTQDVSGLAVGNYTLNVSSCGGAGTAMQTFQITEPANSITLTPTLNPVTCFGDFDGSISLNANGGTGTLVYMWQSANLPNGATGSNLSGLQAGVYNLTVTDANQCTLTESYTVQGPPSALNATASVTDATCNGEDNGAVQIDATGGYGNYTYAWTGGLSGDNPQGIAVGSYDVTVTDAENCATVLTGITVAEPAALSVTATVVNIGEDQTGEIDATPAGGAGAGTYTYAWTGPAAFTAATEDLSGLTVGGEYCLNITDINGCTVEMCFMVQSPLFIEVNNIQPSCASENNGAIDLNTFGGQGTITYAWTLNDAPFAATTEDLTGLAGGTYAVTATDANGGTDELIIALEEADAPLSVVPNVIQLSEEGACDGMINVSTVTGGFGNYTFVWNTVPQMTTAVISDLCAGSYTVTITDEEGCTITNTTNIQFIPEPLTIDAVMTDVSCAGECDGEVTVNMPTGIAPFTVTLVAADGMILDSGLTANASITFGDLCPQTVSVNVEDSAGQTASLTDLVIAEPEELLITGATIFPVTIAGGNNGAINVTVEGGTGDYEFDWNSGNGQNNINLPTGNYIVTVTDDNGCTVTASYAVNLFTIANFATTDNNCADDENGEICAQVNGGNGDYTYSWSNGQSTECISGQAAGTYSVTVTDNASGVSINGSATINTLSNLAVTADASTLFTGGANISCAGRTDGAAMANATGANGVVTYLWSNGAATSTVNNLGAGLYTVTATDGAGCESIAEVVLNEPTPFTVNIETDGISCNGERDATVTAVTTGGAATDPENYDYEWTGTGIINAFLPTVNNLGTGIVNVRVTDPNGCETTATTEILEPVILTAEAETTPDDGSGNGTAIVLPEGGTEPYSYEWRSNGMVGTTQEITDVAAGSYIVIVTDANGCSLMLQDIIVQDNSLGCLDTRLVITPDGDGLNDEFVINCIENFADNNLEIFNRYGQLVFRQQNYSCGTDDCPNGWRGLNLREDELGGGVYFYVLEYTEAGTKKQLKGSITLLRE